MSVTPVLQTTHDLRLNLIQGQMDDWSQFQVLQADRLTSDLWDVKAHIIGASHLISVKYRGVLFHEILACMEVQADAERIHYGPITDVGTQAHRFADRVDYTFNSKTEKWGAGEAIMLALERRVNIGGDSSMGLMVAFPPIDPAITPKTIILIKMDGKVLKFETVHSYPNEDRIVFTQTIIKETL